MVTISQNSLLISAFTLPQRPSPCSFTIICMWTHTTRIPGLLPFIHFGFLTLNSWTTSHSHTLKWWQYNIGRRNFSMRSLLTFLVTEKSEHSVKRNLKLPYGLLVWSESNHTQGLGEWLISFGMILIFIWANNPCILLIVLLASAVSDKL